METHEFLLSTRHTRRVPFTSLVRPVYCSRSLTCNPGAKPSCYPQGGQDEAILDHGHVGQWFVIYYRK